MKPVQVVWRLFSVLALSVFVLGGTVSGLPAQASVLQPPPPELTVSPDGLQVSRVVDDVDLESAVRTPDGRVRVIVELVDPPLALYTGGIQGLAPTHLRTSGEAKLNVADAASTAYINYLQSIQTAFTTQLAQAIPEATVDMTYQAAFNGLALAIPAERVKDLQRLSGVYKVYPDRLNTVELDASLNIINAPEVWDMLGGRADAGSGVFVAVIDSGINSKHPMFSGAGFTMPPGYPRGYCVTNPADPEFQCNAKLVAARFYAPPPMSIDVHPAEVLSPLDIDGHGSHTAGIATGNQVTVTDTNVVAEPTVISGVAPGAYVMAYKGLFHTQDGNASGTDSMLLGALNDALADGADVINNSWGGDPGGDPNTNPFQTTIRALVQANVVVVFSAGNSGPDENTIGCPSCVEETISVAATTTDRRFFQDLDVLGPEPIPPALQNVEIRAGSGPVLTETITGTIEFAGEVDSANVRGCSPFPANAFQDEIALMERGDCNFSVKVDNAAAAGAIAALIYNNVPGNEFINMATETTTIPSFFMLQADGLALADFITTTATTTVTGRINFEAARREVVPDIVGSFSSVGPGGDPDVLKPDIAAPGVDILSAYSPALGGQNYAQVSGTSQASPHVAGAAALLRELYPDWGAEEIRTALTSTADQTLFLPDEVTPATHFHMGSGRLNVLSASQAGVTFDKSSMADVECLMQCEWTREIENMTDQTVTWVARVVAPPGLNVSVTPSSFTLPPRLKGDFVVTAKSTGQVDDDWHDAAVIWEDASGTHPDAYLPIAVKLVSSTQTQVLTKEATPTAGPGGTISYTIAISNTFPFTETFMIRDVVPTGTTYISGTATGGLGFDPATNVLSATVEIGMPGVSLGPSLSPFGYLSLPVDFGVPPEPCTATCDDTIIDVTGVDFFYNGVHYDSFSMVTNGYIVPGTTSSGTGVNQELPDPTDPNNVIAPLWADFDLNGSDPSDAGAGDMFIALLNAGSTSFYVLEWNIVELAGVPGSAFTFQIWIEVGTDNIWFVYDELDGSLDTATVGVEDSSGTQGFSYYFNGAGTAPVLGTELQVLPFPETMSFEFAVRVNDNLGTLTEITNVVQATRSQGAETFIAFAKTKIPTLFIPLIHR
jgi:uncharacterized repeat protein (TIGR01451 family)